MAGLVLGWLGGRTDRLADAGRRQSGAANLGLSVFIGTVAIGAGAPFVQTVASSGIQILLGGAAVLFTLVLIVLVGGHLLGIPFDDLLGVCAGSTGNPAIVAVGADRADHIGMRSAFRACDRQDHCRSGLAELKIGARRHIVSRGAGGQHSLRRDMNALAFA